MMEYTQKYLEGKYALVTGSTSGIGLEIVKSLASRGCNIFLNGFGEEDVIEKIKETISLDYGVSVHYIPCDLSKAEEIEQLVERVNELCPILDILVNNAGFQKSFMVEEIEDDFWQKNLDVMLTAPFKLIKAFLPKMKEEEYGRIVNISSVLGIRGNMNESAYCAAKHGIIGLTKCVALETASTLVTCNAILPGAVETPLFMGCIKDIAETNGARSKKVLNEALNSLPAKDFVPVENISEMVAFLCSNSARGMNGSSVVIDGAASTDVKPPPKEPPKSNPSKRHRERLNAELDHLANLLPFEQSVISKLDKLSILRLAVSYLRTKSYFHAVLQNQRYASHHHYYGGAEASFTETDSVLQALNGFLFIVSCDGEVFFASKTVEQYLGFHQSDIIHQSALELIHSEDREAFKSQLNWRSQLPADRHDMSLHDALQAENSQLMTRSFTVRFRCLLDNTSGFITLEITGHMKALLGQNLRGEDQQQVALFAMCSPFGPLPILDMPPRDYTFKTKHKMDMAPLSIDHRGRLLFGYSDRDLLDKGGYDLIHPDDINYYAAAHQEMIKTGSSGLIAYRMLTKDYRWLWLQSSSKVVYKNSKPDYVMCTHRHLTDDEGRELVTKRGTEFKLPYPLIDSDPSSNAFEDDKSIALSTTKKPKAQLKEYLHTGRKRKTPTTYAPINNPPYPPTGYSSDLVYSPYASYPLDTADIYRTNYMSVYDNAYYSQYPLSASQYGYGYAPYTDGYGLDLRRQHYENYYGLTADDARQRHSTVIRSACCEQKNGLDDAVALCTSISSNSSPASATTATSVIQTKNKEKSGAIAVPVVKSWPTCSSAYDWPDYSGTSYHHTDCLAPARFSYSEVSQTLLSQTS